MSEQHDDHHHHHHHKHHHKHHHSEDEKEDHANKKQKKDTPEGEHPHAGWTSLFTRTTAGEICHRNLKTIKTTDTISHLLHTLSANNILSCPVLSPSHEFVGFVDTLDVAGFILTTWKKHSKELEHGKFPSGDFFNSHVDKVLNFSHVDPSVVVEEGSSLLDLVDLFTDPSLHLRLHRVAVVDSKKKVVGIVSQSDIVHFAHKNIKHLPQELAEVKLKDLRIGRSLIFVRLDSSFIDTLETLYRNRISGLALVDDQFRLSGNISTSDLRGISPSSFDYFLGSTLQFLVKGRKGPVTAPISVGMETTLAELLGTFVRDKVHRVYVSDENDRPHTLVSLGDVIARII